MKSPQILTPPSFLDLQTIGLYHSVGSLTETKIQASISVLISCLSHSFKGIGIILGILCLYGFVLSFERISNISIKLPKLFNISGNFDLMSIFV